MSEKAVQLNYFIPFQVNDEPTGNLPAQPAEVSDELEKDSGANTPWASNT